MVDRLLVAIECRRCHEWFELCLSCYRGHAYCSDECRDQARQEQKRRARAEYLRSLGQEAVREANQQRKQRSRHPEEQAGVTDHTAKARPEPVGTDQRDRRSQAVSATVEQGSGRVLDEACEQQPPAPSPGPGLSRPAEVPSGYDSATLAALVRQPPAVAPDGSATAVATAEQGGADVVLGWQQQAPPGAVLGRCSCCGQPGWLVPWVLPAHAQQRSLRHLLATGGP